MRGLLSVLCALSVLTATNGSWDQERESSPRRVNQIAATCDKEKALFLVDEALADVRAVDGDSAVIPIFIKAADSLWRYREEAARKVLQEAYESAEARYEAKGDEHSTYGRLKVYGEDPRFMVIRAIARYDAEWAKRLTNEKIVEARRRATTRSGESEEDLSRAGGPVQSVTEKLLALAISTVGLDAKAAVEIAEATLAYPPSLATTHFLFRLAEVDQRAADRFFERTLAPNSRTADSLMAISAYPFGLNRVAGTQKMTSYFLPPSNFVPKVDLQRSFLTVLSRLANQSLAEGVSASGLGARASEAALYFAILADLEPVVAAANPPLIRNLSALKDSLYSVLPLQIREELTTMQEQHASQSRRSLKDAVDQAIREPSPARRNSAVASAVMNASSDESPESLVEAALRIDDLRLREELFNWLYFKLARKAIATGQYDEGRKLASKVSRLEWRAYLLYEAAAGTLKNQDRVRAREMLSEVSAAAYSAPNTDEKVRTLIGIAHLYSSFDRIDAQVAIMEAVKTINRLTKPNLGNTVLTLKIEAAGFSHFASYNVAAFNMDAVLREMAQVDLDGAVLIARKIEHPSLRAASLLALSAHCLEQPGTSPMPLNKQSVRNDGRER